MQERRGTQRDGAVVAAADRRPIADLDRVRFAFHRRIDGQNDIAGPALAVGRRQPDARGGLNLLGKDFGRANGHPLRLHLDATRPRNQRRAARLPEHRRREDQRQAHAGHTAHGPGKDP